MREVTDLVFDKPLVILYVTATWCAPCRILSPIMEAVEMEIPSVRFLKADADKCKPLTLRLGIKSVPMLIAFRDGSEVARITGPSRHQQVTDWVASLMV